MKGTDEYLQEEEYESIFKRKIKIMNILKPSDNYEYAVDYAYGGAKLVKRNKATGGEQDLSVRFFYDEDGTADYDAFKELLDTVNNILKEKE